MKATFEWFGPTRRLLAKGTLYGPSTYNLLLAATERALEKADTHDPPVTKWTELVITVRNNDQRSTPHE